MASNQIYDRRMELDKIAQDQRQFSLVQTLKEAEFQRRYELEKQQMRQQREQQAQDTAMRQREFELKKQILSRPEEKGFNLSEALYRDYRQGDNAPEVLQGLGMYIKPQAPESMLRQSSQGQVAEMTPYQQAQIELQRDKLKGQQKKEERVATKNNEVQERAKNLTIEAAQDMLKIVEEITKDDGLSNFGFTGKFPSIPGSKRVNWEANIDRLRSQKVLDVMTAIKQASQTGATGFGQLSEKELQLLQSAATALRRDMSPQDAQRYLDFIQEKAKKILSNNNTGTYNGAEKNNNVTVEWLD